MADDNKNLASDTERTSILPQSEPQVAEQTEVLPTHESQAETAQMPPIAQQEGAGAFADTPLESVAEASAAEPAGAEAVAASAATGGACIEEILVGQARRHCRSRRGNPLRRLRRGHHHACGRYGRWSGLLRAGLRRRLQRPG